MISTLYGASYLNWLAVLIETSGNRCDLTAYFFRRAEARSLERMEPSADYRSDQNDLPSRRGIRGREDYNVF